MHGSGLVSVLLALVFLATMCCLLLDFILCVSHL